MTEFSGRVAIVTGGGGAIGGATVAMLAARGATVVVADLDMDAASGVAARVDPAGRATNAMAVDLAEEASIAAMIDATLAAHGRLDILVNNAAYLAAGVSDTDVERMAVEAWDLAFRVNTRGTMLCCKYALPHIVASGGGAIVNVASNLALQGNVIQHAYSASKAAILQMTRSIATSHGRRGVRCNAVLPGLTLTAMAEANLPRRLRDLQLGETLLPRLCRPDDIAHAIVFLASDQAAQITAQALVVDGGNGAHVPGLPGLLELFGQC